MADTATADGPAQRPHAPAQPVDSAAGAAAGAAGAAPNGAPAPELTPEQKAKKAAKAAEKEAKKAKALAKKEKMAAQAAGTSAGADKKAKAKAESEAKRADEVAELRAALEAARSTPKGQKKETSAATMPKGYDPPTVEAAWYEWWEAQGYFKPRADASGEPFVMVIPPPNVTGSLHLGHALTNAIQDTVIRWRRMCGRDTLWVPGNDHAGIATQAVVEKALKRERGLSRHDLGRESFMEEVYKWVDQYGGTINQQLRRIGSSLDWTRQVFTMDDKLSAAVLEAFLRLHAKGLIYRDNRLVNWDCALRSAISDVEVDDLQLDGITLLSVPGYDQQVEFGAMKEFAYPVEGSGGELVVATTRIETMLGDTAVCIHPQDPRYKHLHGKFVIHPVDGRRLPIACDAEAVDMELGTGAVKITPAHDAKDFATGKRNGLAFINVLNDDGTLNDNCGPFSGKPRYEVRRTIVEFLEGKGLFRGTKPNPMVLGQSSRSKDIIEPLMRPQWWVNCQEMAAAAKAACAPSPAEAVLGESFGLRPAAAQRDWARWLDNIRDWCISRQLWWGHRIPAFYIALDGETANAAGGPNERMDRWVVAKDEAGARAKAEEKFPDRQISLTQDEDVLDTWFSSGLFPFSVFSWPGDSQGADLGRYFPGALLETGRDILFFWVARMVMMSMSLTGKVPFEQVYLHAMVRDAHGNKMSKSLGNALDPVDVIEGISLADLHTKLETGNLDPKELKRARAAQAADFPDGIEQCGTDALRFALVSYTTQGGDINLDIKKVIAYRHWCNKLWNAIKFALKNLGDDFRPSPSHAAAGRPLADRWILSRLAAAVAAVNTRLGDYEFGPATQALYAFWQYEVCDVFIELCKPVLGDPAASDPEAVQTKRDTLWVCLDTGLRLLHPFMPFVTEELWQRLPRGEDQQAASIMIAPYPQPSDAGAADWSDQQAEAQMEAANRVVNALRGLRAQYGLSKQKPAVRLAVTQPQAAEGLEAAADAIATLSLSSTVTVQRDGDAPEGDSGVVVVDDATTAYLDLAGILDPKKEAAKLQKQLKELEGRLETLNKRTGLPSYAGTPDNVKAADVAKRERMAAELAAVRQNLERYQSRA